LKNNEMLVWSGFGVQLSTLCRQLRPQEDAAELVKLKKGKLVVEEEEDKSITVGTSAPGQRLCGTVKFVEEKTEQKHERIYVLFDDPPPELSKLVFEKRFIVKGVMAASKGDRLHSPFFPGDDAEGR